MTHHTALHARALAAIPDTPVTVETRALAQDAATIVHAIGAAALRPVIAGLLARGMHPVWGAIESNAGSLALARSLGFTQPAGTLRVASRRQAPRRCARAIPRSRGAHCIENPGGQWRTS